MASALSSLSSRPRSRSAIQSTGKLLLRAGAKLLQAGGSPAPALLVWEFGPIRKVGEKEAEVELSARILDVAGHRWRAGT
jgi:hypothetical protein